MLYELTIGLTFENFCQAPWSGGARFGSVSLVLRGAAWLLGGQGTGYQRQFSHVFAETSNGANCLPLQPSDTCADKPGGTPLEWVLASDESVTPWSARSFMGALPYNDRLYTIGGASSECVLDNQGISNCILTRTLGEVWQSAAVGDVAVGDLTLSAQISWTSVTGNAPWGTRAKMAVVVFKNKMWLIGGQSISGPSNALIIKMYNDVWASDSGSQWDTVSFEAAWQPRCGHTAAVFPHENVQHIFVIGGSDLSRYFNDVWRSHDGVEWTLVTAEAAFAGRWLHATVSFRNNLWVLGGHTCKAPPSTQQPETYVCSRTNKDPGSFYNDVWYSKDGAYWRASTTSARWSPRAAMSVHVFTQPRLENLWVVGGYDGFGRALNDTYAAFSF